MNRRTALSITFIGLNLMACCCAGAGNQKAAPDFKAVGGGEKNGAKFTVETRMTKDGFRVLDLVFSQDPKSPEFVDETLRSSLEKAVNEDGASDILATAFIGDTVMNSNQYSGLLFYKASEKRILTDDEWMGVKTTTVESPSYFVQIRQLKTLEGIKPARKWLDLTIVFPKAPPQEEAYRAIATEVGKVVDKGLDVNAYVSAGERGTRTSWQQMRDNDGAFVFANYSAASGKLTRKGVVISFRRDEKPGPAERPNLAGHWTGTLSQGKFAANLAFELLQDGNKVIGTVERKAGDASAKFQLEGTIVGNLLTFSETKFIKNKSTKKVQWETVRGQLRILTDGNSLILEGEWFSTLSPNRRGRMQLTKQ